MFLSFQSQYELIQELANDTSAASLTRFKRWINVATGMIAHKIGRYPIEDERTITSVSSQQGYVLSPRTIRVSDAYYTLSGNTYPLFEITDEAEWRWLNHTTTPADTPFAYWVDRQKIHLYPKPNTSTGTITIISEERVPKMTAADYTTGTIALTLASATVTGSGTTFTSSMVGRYLEAPDGLWYKITGYTSATVITIERGYEGATASGQSYTIGEQALGRFEDLHMLPVNYAVGLFFARRRSSGKRNEYLDEWRFGLEEAKTNYARRTSDGVITKHSSPYPWRDTYNRYVTR